MNIANKGFDWVNIFFFTILSLFAVIGSLWLCITHGISWATCFLAIGYMVVSGLSVTAGYHRLFAHKSYKAAWPIRLVFLLFGAAAFEGSALEWATDHRNHHRYTDTDKDPYGIHRGFWYAHMGWLFERQSRNYENVQDLSKDRLVWLQHKYYVLIASFMGFGLPVFIAALWGDPLGGLILAGALRTTLNHQFTFMINSVCHYFGKRTYSERQSARDNWVTAFFTFGEGFHNFHHQFPLDYRNGVRAYHFDPTKWLIKALSWFGLAKNLQQVAAHRIIRYRLNVEEQVVLKKVTHELGQKSDFVKQMLESTRDRIHSVLNYFDDLEKEYMQICKNKYVAKKDKINEYHQSLQIYRSRFRAAQQELAGYLADWRAVIKINLKTSVFSPT